jgi:GMP reductase
LEREGLRPDYITIDIAHGHSISMEQMLKWIDCLYIDPSKPRPYIIAGNVSTPAAVRDLELWGADAIKVGIGPGSACTTYMMTGFGSRNIQASAIQECALARGKSATKIIADGGIQQPGDIAKALVLGADLVMAGGFFSGCKDTPGEIIKIPDGTLCKEFWGSASSSQTGGKTSRIEGTKRLVQVKHRSILEEFQFLKECLQSAISYGGGTSLECFKDVKFLTTTT